MVWTLAVPDKFWSIEAFLCVSVVRIRSSAFVFARAALWTREGLNRAQKNHTEPEVNEHPQVQLRRIVARRRRQMRHKQEVNRISRHHGDKALQKVHSSLF